MYLIVEDRAVFPSLDLVSPFNPNCTEGISGKVIVSAEILEAKFRAVRNHKHLPISHSISIGGQNPTIKSVSH